MNKNKMNDGELGQWMDNNLNKGVEYDKPVEYREELVRTYFKNNCVKVITAWFKVIDGKISLKEYKEEESSFDYNVNSNDLKENWEYEVDKGELYVLVEGVIPLGIISGREVIEEGGSHYDLEEDDIPNEVLEKIYMRHGYNYNDLELYDGYEKDVMREWEKLLLSE